MPGFGVISGEIRHLAMVNFEIDAEALSPDVPPGTQIDLWRDKALISVVGYLFHRPRVLGVPVFFRSGFEQVSLRFYVRRETEDGTRHGLAFINQFVSNKILAAISRFFYNKDLVTLPISLKADVYNPTGPAGGNIEYTWNHHGKRHGVHVEFKGEGNLPTPGSEEEFTLARNWGYLSHSQNACLEYRIDHSKWHIRQGSAAAFSCDDADVYGPGLGSCLVRTPSSALVAQNSRVKVHRVKQVDVHP